MFRNRFNFAPRIFSGASLVFVFTSDGRVANASRSTLANGQIFVWLGCVVGLLCDEIVGEECERE